MDRPASTSLLDHFAALEDPRQTAKVLYPLPEILLLLLGATLAGADDFIEMELWGNEQLAFLRRLLPYRHGIPVTTRWARWWPRSILRCSRPAS
jgi:hypothetical protein